jgi:hypothetical protein
MQNRCTIQKHGKQLVEKVVEISKTEVAMNDVGAISKECQQTGSGQRDLNLDK